MTKCECKECIKTQHDSDCAVHNGPAMPMGKCDCSEPYIPLWLPLLMGVSVLFLSSVLYEIFF